MADLTYENALKAMRRAHENGDMAAARRMAALAKKLQDSQPARPDSILPPGYTPQAPGLAGVADAAINRLNEVPVDNNSKLGFVNKGIANVVDFLNPFDNEAWGNVAGGRFQTPPAADVLRGFGAATADRPPGTGWEHFFTGVGKSATAAPGITKLLQMGAKAPGVLGGVMDDAHRAMATRGGMVADAAAGGVSAAASHKAREAGFPDWVADAAGIAAPAVGIPAAIGATKAATRGAGTVAGAVTPTGIATRWAKRTIAPMTETGGREIAREELRDLVGHDRLREVAGMIPHENPLGLTPAQATGDPGLLSLEGAARGNDASLDAALRAQADESRRRASGEVMAMGGDVPPARAFMSDRFKQFKANMQDRIDRVMSLAADEVGRVGNVPGEEPLSSRVVAKLRSELDDAKSTNRDLWSQIDLEEVVPVAESRAVLRHWVENTPTAQQEDIPAIARRFLLDGPDAFEGAETALEMHGLYSKLRGVARYERSLQPGARNEFRAKIADEIANAILADLGSVDQSTKVGRDIAAALDHTRAMHETFDQGAPGRLLSRTRAGDERVAEGAALGKTVGGGGPSGADDYDRIIKAAPTARGEVWDFLRDRFHSAVIDPSGKFTPAKAKRWLDQNKEILARAGGAAKMFKSALASREAAEGFTARAELRTKAADGSFAAKFAGEPNKAVLQILTAPDPAAAAQSAFRTASKDASGVAVAGVKGAFLDTLIGKALGPNALLSGNKMAAVANDPATRAAMEKFFTPAELDRFSTIAKHLQAVDASRAVDAPVANRESTPLLRRVVQVMAAATGRRVAEATGGGTVQTPGIFVASATNTLSRLTNDRARRLLMDAVRDPELMRDLLTEVPIGGDLKPEIRVRLAPYLVGGASNSGDREYGSGLLGQLVRDPAPGLLSALHSQGGGGGLLGALTGQ